MSVCTRVDKPQGTNERTPWTIKGYYLPTRPRIASNATKGETSDDSAPPLSYLPRTPASSSPVQLCLPSHTKPSGPHLDITRIRFQLRELEVHGSPAGVALVPSLRPPLLQERNDRLQIERAFACWTDACRARGAEPTSPYPGTRDTLRALSSEPEGWRNFRAIGRPHSVG